MAKCLIYLGTFKYHFWVSLWMPYWLQLACWKPFIFFNILTHVQKEYLAFISEFLLAFTVYLKIAFLRMVAPIVLSMYRGLAPGGKGSSLCLISVSWLWSAGMPACYFYLAIMDASPSPVAICRRSSPGRLHFLPCTPVSPARSPPHRPAWWPPRWQPVQSP